jgi:hypothetical protein
MVRVCPKLDTNPALAVAERHPGWLVRANRPMATRSAGHHHKPDASDAVYAETVIADSWRELDDELAEQDANDERYA